jgi:hypothetical protein
MRQLHSSASHARYVLPIPGVPESQARALDRRVKLHRQLESFRGLPRVDLTQTPLIVNDQAGPAQA